MAPSIWSKIQSYFTGPQKPRLFIDAASFDPCSIQPNGRAVLIVTYNREDCIFERVTAERTRASGVVVLDQGSSDATPYLAAEAGAIVVLQEQGVIEEEALRKAICMARLFSENIEVLRE